MRMYSYDLATGTIIEGGYYQPNVDPATQGLLTIENDDTPHPDKRTKRITDGVLRDATADELAAFDTVKFDADALAAVRSNVVITALGITLESRRLGREMTPQEQLGLLAEVKARVKALRAG
jgi:hypothetical protein